ncbi:sensor domain-containing diguanylate cyclase, partial [bacterium]
LQDSLFQEVMQKRTPRFFEEGESPAMPLILSVPLVSRKKVIGFLNIHTMYKSIQLTQDKIELVYALASQASIAISNAQLFQALREQAIIDPCTTLYNFRYFQQKLDEEIDVYNSSKEPLSLIILDIDHFKKVNDNYGHVYGDTVLRELGNIMKRNVRSEDSVCRYGGEEFAIIFPHCTQEVTLRIADRIRSRIQETSSHDRRSTFKEPITVSIGVAGYEPEMSKTLFIQRADNALYYAKNHGRNMVSGYDSQLESEYANYQKKK